MKTASDTDLLAMIHAGPGGEDALETLIHRHGAMVLATCRRITGRHHDAEEAAQAVMLVLHDKAKRGLEVECLPAWLHRVACFVAVRLRDARLRQGRREVGLAPEQAVSAGDDAPESDLSRRLDEALDRLPAHYRMPLILHYMESCSFAEIGARLAIRAETVAMRVSRARGMVRRHLMVPERMLDLGALLVPPSAVSSAAAWSGTASPTPAVLILARHYLRRQVLMPAIRMAAAGAAVVLVGCAILACASGHRDGAAPAAPVAAVADGAQASATVAAVATVAVPAADYPRSEFPGPLWQERLVAELNRPVTLAAPAQSVWTLIDSIGQQTGIAMLADGSLGDFHATLPPLNLDGESLQTVLDRICAAAGLRCSMYAGGLLWQATGVVDTHQDVVAADDPEPLFSVRVYHMADLPGGKSATAPSSDQVVKDLLQVADLHWDSEGCGIEESASKVIISHRADAENALDAQLRPAPYAPAEAVPDGPAPAVDPAERDLFRAMDHPTGPLPAGTPRLDALIAALARDAGIDLQVVGASPTLGQPLAPRPLPLRLDGMPLRFALSHLLEGTGLRAAFHIDGGGAGAAPRPLLVIGTTAAAQFISASYPWPLPTQAGTTAAVAAPDTPDTAVIWVMKTVHAQSWTVEGASIETDDRFIRLRQSREVMHDVNEQMPRFALFWNGYRLAPRVPLAPRLIIPAAGE